mgnify:CR=1 FL=1
MSTKSTIYCNETNDPQRDKHLLNIHIFEDFHESDDTVMVDMTCSACHCAYQFLLTKHLGDQLAEALKASSKLNGWHSKIMETK